MGKDITCLLYPQAGTTAKTEDMLHRGNEGDILKPGHCNHLHIWGSGLGSPRIQSTGESQAKPQHLLSGGGPPVAFSIIKQYALSYHDGLTHIRVSSLTDKNLWVYDLALMHILCDQTTYITDFYAKTPTASSSKDEDAGGITIGIEWKFSKLWEGFISWYRKSSKGSSALVQ